jgi:4-aminobutyrate aminotransferase-like enzyme
MQTDGVRLAAFLADTIFASDGVFAHPPGFLAAAVRHVHAAGGLFIADEVQPGFGRVGEVMWGFQRHGVVPDLVTMGKPMGNGHPVAAVAARPNLFAAQRCPAIRDIRGAGLFIGVELGANPASGLSGHAETTRVVNAMRHLGVLVGATGCKGEVLKIRPPLTFELQHADRLLDALDQALQTKS